MPCRHTHYMPPYKPNVIRVFVWNNFLPIKQGLWRALFMKEINAFECSHCGNIYRSERGVSRHEHFCTKNPLNFIVCGLCSYFVTEEIERPDVYGVDRSIKSKKFRCLKFDRLLYSATMERKGYLKRYPNSFESAIKMPAECSEFNSK